MERQVDVGILDASPDGAFVRVTWLICDNGMTAAQGTGVFHHDGGRIAWDPDAPPAEYEGLVRCAIEDAARKRTHL
jgi:hypothetical protein